MKIHFVLIKSAADLQWCFWPKNLKHHNRSRLWNVLSTKKCFSSILSNGKKMTDVISSEFTCIRYQIEPHKQNFCMISMRTGLVFKMCKILLIFQDLVAS